MPDLCRKHDLNSATFRKWEATDGVMDVPQAHKLNALEDETSRPKRLLADAMLDNAVFTESPQTTDEAYRTAQGHRECSTDHCDRRAPGMFNGRGWAWMRHTHRRSDNGVPWSRLREISLERRRFRLLATVDRFAPPSYGNSQIEKNVSLRSVTKRNI